MTEAQRILEEYARRALTIPSDRYSLHKPENLFAHQQRARRLLRLLAGENLLPFGDRALLDVGCGDGQQLLDFVSWGARRGQLLCSAVAVRSKRRDQTRRRCEPDALNRTP